MTTTELSHYIDKYQHAELSPDDNDEYTASQLTQLNGGYRLSGGVQDFYGSGRTGGRKGRTPSHLVPWLNHVARVRASHPGLAPKQVLKAASQTYRRGAGGALSGGRRPRRRRM